MDKLEEIRELSESSGYLRALEDIMNIVKDKESVDKMWLLGALISFYEVERAKNFRDSSKD